MCHKTQTINQQKITYKGRCAIKHKQTNKQTNFAIQILYNEMVEILLIPYS